MKQSTRQNFTPIKRLLVCEMFDWHMLCSTQSTNQMWHLVTFLYFLYFSFFLYFLINMAFLLRTPVKIRFVFHSNYGLYTYTEKL